MKNEINFEKLDQITNFQDQNQKKHIAKKNGFGTISGFIHSLYYGKKLSLLEISKIMQVAETSVYWWMDRWNFARRKTGGWNRDERRQNTELKKKIKAMKGVKKAKEAAEEIGCSVAFINMIWREDDYIEIKCTKCGRMFKTLTKSRGVIGIKYRRCKNCRRTVTKLAKSAQEPEEKPKYKRLHLSTWKSRGVTKETWQKTSLELERESWREHRGDKHIPLDEKTMRIGEYKSF